jgi:hypothetical protein
MVPKKIPLRILAGRAQGEETNRVPRRICGRPHGTTAAAVAASRELKHETCLMCCGTAKHRETDKKNQNFFYFYFYLSVTHWPEVREKKKKKEIRDFRSAGLTRAFLGLDDKLIPVRGCRPHSLAEFLDCQPGKKKERRKRLSTVPHTMGGW